MNYNQKTPFEVFHIAEDDPNRYEKLCNEMISRDDSFMHDTWTSGIYDRHYVAARLLEPKTIQEQFLEMLKDEDYYISRSAKDAYESFKDEMAKIGAERVTKYDWSNMAKVCMERDLRDCLELSLNIRDLASYLGYFNFENSPAEEKWNAISDILQEVRENFRQIYAKCHDVDIAFDTFISKEQEEKIRNILFNGPEIENEERDITEN